MTFSNFKEIYVTGKVNACEVVIQKYKNKNYVLRNEFVVMKGAWENNTENIQDLYTENA